MLKAEKPIRLKPKTETIKFLILRSGNQCAFPGCNHEIFNSKNELIAECCHIEAAMPNGQRFNAQSSNEYRRSSENLVFLCHRHHKETDNTDVYTVQKLKQIKSDHECQFSSNKTEVNSSQVALVLEAFQNLEDRTINIDKTVKRIESKQDDLLNAIKSESLREQPRTPTEYLLPPVVQNFFGRKKEIELFDNGFNNHNCIQVSGISGIGKSSFIAHQVVRKNARALWVDCTITKSLSQFQNILAQYLEKEYDDSRFENELLQANSNLESILQKLDEKKLCIVLDALDSKEHPLTSLVEFCNRRFAKSKLIFSTIIEHSFLSAPNAISNLKLTGIDPEGFKAFISHFVDGDINPITEFQFYKVTGGHPFLIRLVASLTPYQPLDTLLSELSDQPNEEISKFITTKVYERLNNDEKEFVASVLHLGIPFQYEFVNYVNSPNSKDSFISLQRKSLIEKDHNDLFYVPDFLVPYLKSFLIEANHEIYYQCGAEYLSSLKESARIFERWALVQIEIQLDNFALAENYAITLFSGLMQQGQFGLLLNLALMLEESHKMNDSAYIFYCIGRVYRFQEFYEESLKYYEKGIEKRGEERLIEGLKFERASILSFLAREKLRSFEEAKNAFKELLSSNDESIAIQSKIALYYDSIWHNDLSVIKDMREYLSELDASRIEVNIVASAWYILGTGLAKTQDYGEAIKCFTKSLELYERALEVYGMNSIDGLLNAYQQFGWAYVKNDQLEKGVQMFATGANLAFDYGLTMQYERILFDFGYHLILLREYASAADALEKHYEVILSNKMFDQLDMKLVYRALVFSHWYSGQFEDAVELIGLFTIEWIRDVRNIRPPISIAQQDAKIEEVDPLDFFQRHMLLLFLPENKTLSDFQDWIDSAIKRKPELKEVLSSFGRPTDDDFKDP